MTLSTLPDKSYIQNAGHEEYNYNNFVVTWLFALWCLHIHNKLWGILSPAHLRIIR